MPSSSRGRAASITILTSLTLLAADARGPARVGVRLVGGPTPATETVEAAEEVLARLSGVPALRLEVRNEEGDGASRGADLPPVTLVSLPLYLELVASGVEARILRVPRRGAETRERYHLVARAGEGSAGAIADGPVLGALLWAPDFVAARLFPGHLDGRELRFVPQPLRAIRALRRGEAGAVVLADVELEALAGLIPADELVTVATSPPVPLPLLVGIGPPGPDEPAILRAWDGLCGDPDGSYLCDGFGVDGFGAPGPELVRWLATLGR